jgi:hypothetical protein
MSLEVPLIASQGRGNRVPCRETRLVGNRFGLFSRGEQNGFVGHADCFIDELMNDR